MTPPSLAILLVAILSFIHNPVHAMDDDGDEPPAHVAAAPAAEPPTADEVFDSGYFVYTLSTNIFKPDHDLTLSRVCMTPVTLDLSDPEEIAKLLENSGCRAGPEQIAEMKKTLAESVSPRALMELMRHNPDGFFPCFYFTLNCVGALEPHMFQHTVLIPAHHLMPYVVNFSPLATAVWKPEINLRDFPGSIIMVPEAFQIPDDFDLGGVEVRRYVGGLEGAVGETLDELTGYRLALTGLPDTYAPYTQRAMLGELDLLDPSFFASYLGAHPWVSFGAEVSAKRQGLGSWLSLLRLGMEEFARTWKIGIFKKAHGSEPRFLKRFRIEPFITLAEVALEQVEALLREMDVEEVLEDFHSVQKPKIEYALSNFRNMVEVNQSEEVPEGKTQSKRDKWLKRPYASEAFLRLADFPYAVASQVMSAPSFADVREEAMIFYWFTRYIQRFYGVLPQDDTDVEAQLMEAAIAFRDKLDAGNYSWTYVQYLNMLLTAHNSGHSLDGFNQYFLEALEILKPTFPKSGKVSIALHKGEAIGEVNLRKNCEDLGLAFPDGLLEDGVENVPLIQAPGPLDKVM